MTLNIKIRGSRWSDSNLLASPREVTAHIPSCSYLNTPCCPPKVGHGAKRLPDPTQADCSGQEPYLWASYLLPPGSPLPAHSDSQFSSVLSHEKHCWKVLADRETLPANHCLKARKVRKSEKVHWKSVRKAVNTGQHERKKKSHGNTDISKCGKGKASFKQGFPTRSRIGETLLCGIQYLIQKGQGEVGGRKRGKGQNPCRTSAISETGFQGWTWRRTRKTCLPTIFKCVSGEINTRKFFADRMCFPYF